MGTFLKHFLSTFFRCEIHIQQLLVHSFFLLALPAIYDVYMVLIKPFESHVTYHRVTSVNPFNLSTIVYALGK